MASLNNQYFLEKKLFQKIVTKVEFLEFCMSSIVYLVMILFCFAFIEIDLLFLYISFIMC